MEIRAPFVPAAGAVQRRKPMLRFFGLFPVFAAAYVADRKLSDQSD